MQHGDQIADGLVIPGVFQLLDQFVQRIGAVTQEADELPHGALQGRDGALRRGDRGRDLVDRGVQAVQDVVEQLDVPFQAVKDQLNTGGQVAVHQRTQGRHVPGHTLEQVQREQGILPVHFQVVQFVLNALQTVDDRVQAAGRDGDAGGAAVFRQSLAHELRQGLGPGAQGDGRVDVDRGDGGAGKAVEKVLQLRQHVPHLLRAHTQIVPGFAQHGVRRHDDHIRVVDGVQRRVDVLGALQATDEVRVHHPQAADHIGIIPQGIPQPGQQADQVIQRGLRVQLIHKRIRLFQHVFDQYREILDLNVVLDGVGGRIGDFVGDGVGLRVLVENDGGFLVPQRGHDVVHVAGHVLFHDQRAIIGAVDDPGHRLGRVVHNDPADAGGFGDLFNRLPTVIDIRAVLCRVARIRAGQGDLDVAGVGVGIPVGVDVHPGIERRQNQHRKYDHDRKEVGKEPA